MKTSFPKAVFSWTKTVCAFLSGALDVADLEGVIFYFSCSRSHIVRNDKLIPYEATWKNKQKSTKHIGIGKLKDGVCPRQVDCCNLTKVRLLLNIIRKADENDRVFWQTTNIERVISQLPNETHVFMGRLWRRAWHYKSLPT